jgi:hypothetical protein
MSANATKAFPPRGAAGYGQGFARLAPAGGWAQALLLFGLAFLLSAAFLQPALAFEPSRAELLYQSARFDMLEGKDPAALGKVAQARALDPADARLKALQAELLIRLGRPEEALKLCKELSAQDPGDIQAPVLAARALAALGRLPQALDRLKPVEASQPGLAIRVQIDLLSRAGKYEEVLAAVRRAEAMGPALTLMERQEIFFAGGRAAYRNQDNQESLRLLDQAYDLAPRSNLAREIKAWRHDVKLGDRFWYLGAQAGFLYDSNVYLDPIFDDPAHATVSGRSDSAWLAEAWGGSRLKRWSNGLELGVTAHAQMVAYFKETEATASYLSPGAYLAWGRAKWGFRLPYRFYYYYRGARKDDWSRMHSFTPYVYWQMTSHLKTYFSVILFERQYFDGRSGAVHGGLAIDHVWSFDRKSNYLRLSYRVDQEDAYDDISGYTGLELTLGAGRQLFENLKIEADMTWAHYNYNNRPEWTLDYQVFQRKDEQLRLSLQLVYSLPQWWKLRLNYYYITNDSNVEGQGVSPYDYDKYVVSFLVTKYF